MRRKVDATWYVQVFHVLVQVFLGSGIPCIGSGIPCIGSGIPVLVQVFHVLVQVFLGLDIPGSFKDALKYAFQAHSKMHFNLNIL